MELISEWCIGRDIKQYLSENPNANRKDLVCFYYSDPLPLSDITELVNRLLRSPAVWSIFIEKTLSTEM